MADVESPSRLDIEGASFVEHYVEADGFTIRYLEAGQGPPLVYLHGGGGLQLTPAHGLLADRYRVLVFEMPGFGASGENTRSGNLSQLAATMAQAVSAAGVSHFSLWGTSLGGATALRLAVANAGLIEALVLESPAAIRPERSAGLPSPEAMHSLLYAHPERLLPREPDDPAIVAKQRGLMRRLAGPNRDPELERQLPELRVPVLVLFGTEDRLIPPEMGRIYVELLPACSLVFVYDAAHEISSDRPEAFTEVVSDFLERREAFVISRRATQLFP